MKTPDEIKKGLECCLASREYRDCIGCSYGEAKKRGTPPCDCEVKRDALAYIQQLEREKDAAVRDLYHAASDYDSYCGTCKYKGEPCDQRQFEEIECWEWRGVQSCG